MVPEIPAGEAQEPVAVLVRSEAMASPVLMVLLVLPGVLGHKVVLLVLQHIMLVEAVVAVFPLAVLPVPAVMEAAVMVQYRLMPQMLL